MEKLRVGILGATGMVGQRFVHLLGNHPWFEVVAVAASPRSAGKTYAEAVAGRWAMPSEIPSAVAKLVVEDVQSVEALSREVAFVFSALDMDKQAIRDLEDQYAQHECPVVSNNSAHRWTPDVPMIMPEINPEHLDVIGAQRRRLGTRRGFVVAPSWPAAAAWAAASCAATTCCISRSRTGVRPGYPSSS